MSTSRVRWQRTSALLFGGLLAASCGWFQGLEPEARNADPQTSADAGEERFDASEDSAIDSDRSDSGDARSDREPEPHPPGSFGLGVDTTWHPEARRMAATDDSAARGSQDRIWLLARGRESPRLVTKLVNVASDRWFDTTIDGITTDPDGISFSDQSGQRQRVFFGRRGKLGMYRFEDELRGGLEELSPTDGYSIGSGDVAALTFIEAGARHMVVLAPALKGSAAGHYCIFENVEVAPGWHVACSSEPTVAHGADIVAVRVADEAQFYFRNLEHRLSRLRRVAVGQYELEAIATPENAEIGASLAVTANADLERLDITVIGALGRVWNATLPGSAAQGPLRENPSWLLLPELRNGANAASSHAALAALWMTAEGAPALSIFVLDTLGAVQGIADVTGSGWQPKWGESGTLGAGQTLSAIGVLARTDAFDGLPRLFASGGGRTATTLHEVTLWLVAYGFMDHLRPQAESVPALRGPYAETTLAMGPDEGFIAGSRRDGSPPFRLSLNATMDGASSWGAQEQLLTPLRPDKAIDVLPSVVEPLAAYGGGLMHLVSVEIDLPSSCVDPSPASRVVYRRAPNATELVAADESSPGVYDLRPRASQTRQTRHAHPAFVLTEEDGKATAHVLYADGDRFMLYSRIGPEPEAVPDTHALDPSLLRVGPSFLAQGGLERTVYAGTVANGETWICLLDSLPLGVNACTRLAPGIPSVVDVPFGTELADAKGTCAAVGEGSTKCLRDIQPLSLGVHPIYEHRLFAAYAAPHGGGTAIFFTRSRGASSADQQPFGPWTPPRTIHDAPEPYDRFYFDPKVVFESRRVLLITYKVLSEDAGRERVDLYAAISEDEGDNFSHFRLRDSWDPEQAVYDCFRQAWTLGDHGGPGIVGVRALHVVRGGSASAPRIDTRWLSTAMLE